VLSFSTDGMPGITPVVGPGQASACGFSIFTLTTPVQASLATSPVSANPASNNPATVCLSAGATSAVYQVGVSGSPAPPTVTWTPDPGTP
jgi:hypothetical protein